VVVVVDAQRLDSPVTDRAAMILCGCQRTELLRRDPVLPLTLVVARESPTPLATALATEDHLAVGPIALPFLESSTFATPGMASQPSTGMYAEGRQWFQDAAFRAHLGLQLHDHIVSPITEHVYGSDWVAVGIGGPVIVACVSNIAFHSQMLRFDDDPC
jgi:hypothetical protein